MEVFLSICLGLGLSIACGFRVFLPMLILSLCGKFGLVELNDGFQWLSSNYALITFLIAFILEMTAYYIPALDNILDYFSLPVSICAGILLSVSCIQVENPLMLWSLSIINGAVLISLVKSTIAVIRGISTAFFAGLTNNLVSTGENILSLILSILAIFLSFSIVFIVIFLLWLIIKNFSKIKNKLLEKKSIKK